MKRSLGLSVFLVYTLIVASPAASQVGTLNLTGNWTGKWTCKAFDGLKFLIGNKESTMAITQTGTTMNVDIDAGELIYNGVVIPDENKPDEKGEVVLVQCGTDNVPGSGASEGEIIRATVKTKLDSAYATFKAVSIFEADPPEVATCKYSYKRVDQNDPGEGPCP